MTRPSPGPAAAPPAVCYRHPDRPTYVSCVRCGRPICPDCMRPASVGFQCPEEGSGPPVRDLRSVTGRPGLATLARIAPVTTALIAINVAVFVVLVISGSSLVGSGFSSLEARLLQQGLVIAGDHDYYRIFSAMFAHFGLLHIGSNMLVLFVIGVPLERQLGARRFGAVYLVSGLGGGVATYLFADPLQVSGGASGAIFGLLGAYAVVSRRMPTAQLGSVTGTIVINLVITFAIPGISITDHLGGLAVGGLLGAVVAVEGRLPARSAARARALAVEVGAFVLVLVVLVGLAAARTHVLRDRYRLVGAGPVVSAPAGVGLSPLAAPAASPPPPPG